MDSNGFGIAEVLARARAGSKPNLWPRCDLHALVCLLFIVVYCGAGERVHAAFMLSSVYFAYFACSACSACSACPRSAMHGLAKKKADPTPRSAMHGLAKKKADPTPSFAIVLLYAASYLPADACARI